MYILFFRFLCIYLIVHIFFQILDEVLRIIRYIQKAPTGQPRNPKNPYIYMEDELFDLSTMAMEYFKEHIEPTLPEITYFGADYLDFTSFSGTCKLTNDFTSFFQTVNKQFHEVFLNLFRRWLPRLPFI